MLVVVDAFIEERQLLYRQWLLTSKAIRLRVLCLNDIRYLTAESAIGFHPLYLYAASLSHRSELFFSFDAKESPAQQIGSDTCRYVV